jgi:hypothetical protein
MVATELGKRGVMFGAGGSEENPYFSLTVVKTKAMSAISWHTRARATGLTRSLPALCSTLRTRMTIFQSECPGRSHGGCSPIAKTHFFPEAIDVQLFGQTALVASVKLSSSSTGTIRRPKESSDKHERKTLGKCYGNSAPGLPSHTPRKSLWGGRVSTNGIGSKPRP